MSDYLALEWGRRQLHGVAATVSAGRVHVKRCFTLECPEEWDAEHQPKEAGSWLKDRLAELDVSPRHVHVMLRREETVMRRFEMPDASDEDLPELVRFQAVAKSALPIDQLLLDFLPLPRREGVPTRDVLMATIPKAMANTIQAVLSAADLELTSLGAGATSIAELAVRMDDQEAIDSSEMTMVVVRHPGRCEILFTQNRHLLFAHAASLIAEKELPALVTEVSRALVALQGPQATLQVDRVWVLSRSDDVALIEALEQRLGCGVQLLDPFEIDAVAPPDHDLPHNRATVASLVGRLVALVDPIVPEINFLNPRRPAVVRDVRKARAIAAIAGALVLLAGVYGVRAFQLSAMDKSIESGQTALSRQKDELKVLEPDVQAMEAVETWVKRDVNWLDLTRDIADVMGGTERHYITRLRVDLGTGRLRPAVKADGFAKDRHDIETLYAEVVRRKALEMQPKEISRSSTDQEYPYGFELDAELKPIALSEAGKSSESPDGKDAAASRGGQAPNDNSPRPDGAVQGRLH